VVWKVLSSATKEKIVDQRIGNKDGVAAVDAAGGTNKTNLNGAGTGAPQGEFLDTDLNSVTAARSRLATIDAGFYTAARLNTMTYNDMVYAIRLADNPTTVR
jgi:hypothetical protein